MGETSERLAVLLSENSQEVIDQERARLGLDQPLAVQFFKWFWGVLQGDFGV